MPSTNRRARTRHQAAHGDPLLYTNADFADFDDNYLPEFGHVSLSGWDSDVANQFHNLWAEDDSSDLPDDDDGSATGGDVEFIPGLTELASQETINRFLASQVIADEVHDLALELGLEANNNQELGIAELLYPEGQQEQSAPPLPTSPGSSAIPELVEDEPPLSRDERVDITSTSHGFLHLLEAMTIFVGTVRVSAVPLIERNAWRQMAWELFTTTWRLSEPMSAELAAAGLPLDLTSPEAFRASYAARQAAHAELHHGEPSSSSRRRHPRGPRAQQRRY
uniref:CzcA-like protein n=1 Tax=Tricholoma matsutake TaxID=40145 RepID=Q9C4A5_TRIMT|nr:CzcA-like protein [Tricholoma matsutake]